MLQHVVLELCLFVVVLQAGCMLLQDLVEAPNVDLFFKASNVNQNKVTNLEISLQP